MAFSQAQGGVKFNALLPMLDINVGFVPISEIAGRLKLGQSGNRRAKPSAKVCLRPAAVTSWCCNRASSSVLRLCNRLATRRLCRVRLGRAHSGIHATKVTAPD